MDDTDRMQAVLPTPVEVETDSTRFTLTSGTEIHVKSPEATGVAEYLHGLVAPATGYELPIRSDASAGSDTSTRSDASAGSEGTISLGVSEGVSELGSEGYELTVTAEAVWIRATDVGGLFNGVQTLRQLLPPEIEATTPQSASWTIPGGRIRDHPRFGYRGVNLDVARHFFSVETVMEFIDQLARYKLNRLHLHLSDDQGWRIEIESWPELTAHGASTDIDGGSGGYYTKDEYRALVEYAGARNITIVPEIDVPAHTGAVLASYPELAGEDDAPSLPPDGDVALPVDDPATYEFVEDVVGELAEMTPGPYFHIGADEPRAMSEADYATFVERAVPIVEDHGKIPIGWQESIGTGRATEATVAQYWKDTDIEFEDHDLVLSPREHAYLNFRYDEDTPPDGPETFGRRKTSVERAYEWDPGSLLPAVNESAILGVEAALWSEELADLEELEFMAYPRLPGIAELGWSPATETTWESYERRLVAQIPRWDVLGMNYYRSPDVSWPDDSMERRDANS